jgi:hypothetical protein
MIDIETLSADVVASFLGKGPAADELTPEGKWVYKRPQSGTLLQRAKDAVAVLKGEALAVKWPQ